MLKRISVILVSLVLLISNIPPSISQPSLGLSVNTSATVDGPGRLSTGHPSQKLGFQSGGMFFIFYNDGTNYLYKSTGDGSAFTSSTIVRNFASAVRGGFSASPSQAVAFDAVGGIVHWVGVKPHPTATSTSPQVIIAYKRGTVSLSTITWEAEVDVDVNVKQELVSITVDSDGRPWIGYSATIRANNPSGYDTNAYAIRATNFQGTAWNNKLTLASRVGSESYIVIPISLTGPPAARMYFLYCISRSDISGRLWSGVALGAEETITSSSLPPHIVPPCSASVDANSDVHLIFTRRHRQTDSFDIMYIKRAGNAWGTEFLVAQNQKFSDGVSYPASSIDPSTNTFFSIWSSSEGTKAVRRFSNGTFVVGSIPISISEGLTHGLYPSTDTLTGVKVLSLYFINSDVSGQSVMFTTLRVTG